MGSKNRNRPQNQKADQSQAASDAATPGDTTIQPGQDTGAEVTADALEFAEGGTSEPGATTGPLGADVQKLEARDDLGELNPPDAAGWQTFKDNGGTGDVVESTDAPVPDTSEVGESISPIQSTDGDISQVGLGVHQFAQNLLNDANAAGLTEEQVRNRIAVDQAEVTAVLPLGGRQGPTVTVFGTVVQTAAVINLAIENTGLTIGEWNALSEDERTKHIGNLCDKTAVADGEEAYLSSSSETLIGSSKQPSTVKIAGFEVPLGQAVAAAHKASGMTVAEWNAQSDIYREAAIEGQIDTKPAAPAEVVSDPVSTPDPDATVNTNTQFGRGQTTSFQHVDEAASAPAPAPQATIEELQARQAAEATPAANVTPTVQSAVAGASVLAQNTFITIADYMVAMAPKKPISVQDGVRQQILLYRSIQTIINRLDEDFPQVFGALLRLFEENKNGVFHEKYVFRFFEENTLPDEDRRAFRCLLNMIKLLGPVKSRELAMKQIDLESTMKFGVTEPGRQRVYAFFGR